jgi:DNA-directed RNA polymerase specialized sigma24 family protein
MTEQKILHQLTDLMSAPTRRWWEEQILGQHPGLNAAEVVQAALDDARDQRRGLNRLNRVKDFALADRSEAEQVSAWFLDLCLRHARVWVELDALWYRPARAEDRALVQSRCRLYVRRSPNVDPDDLFARAFENARRRAGSFNLEFPFLPWFLRVCNNSAKDLMNEEVWRGLTNREDILTLPAVPADDTLGDPEWVVRELAEAGMEPTPEHLERLARALLRRLGVADPSPGQRETAVEGLRSLWEAACKKDSTGRKMAKLGIACNLQATFATQLHSHSRERNALVRVTDGMIRLTLAQKRKNRGDAVDPGTASLYAGLLADTGHLVVPREHSPEVVEILRQAEQNFLWFSEEFAALRLLGPCWSHASRLRDALAQKARLAAVVQRLAELVTFVEGLNRLDSLDARTSAELASHLRWLTSSVGDIPEDVRSEFQLLLLGLAVVSKNRSGPEGNGKTRRSPHDVDKYAMLARVWRGSRDAGTNLQEADALVAQRFVEVFSARDEDTHQPGHG